MMKRISRVGVMGRWGVGVTAYRAVDLLGWLTELLHAWPSLPFAIKAP